MPMIESSTFMSSRDEWIAKSSNWSQRYQTTEGIIEWLEDKNHPPSHANPVIYYVEVPEAHRRKGVFASFIHALKNDERVETIMFCGVSNHLMEYILFRRDFFNSGGDFTWYRTLPEEKSTARYVCDLV